MAILLTDDFTGTSDTYVKDRAGWEILSGSSSTTTNQNRFRISANRGQIGYSDYSYASNVVWGKQNATANHGISFTCTVTTGTTVISLRNSSAGPAYTAADVSIAVTNTGAFTPRITHRNNGAYVGHLYVGDSVTWNSGDRFVAEHVDNKIYLYRIANGTSTRLPINSGGTDVSAVTAGNGVGVSNLDVFTLDNIEIYSITSVFAGTGTLAGTINGVPSATVSGARGGPATMAGTITGISTANIPGAHGGSGDASGDLPTITADMAGGRNVTGDLAANIDLAFTGDMAGARGVPGDLAANFDLAFTGDLVGARGGSTVDVAGSGSEQLTVVAHQSAPWVTAYSSSSEPWTKLADPLDLPPSNTFGVAFNAAGTRAIVTGNDAPRMIAYDTTTTPWTKLANPATMIDNRANAAAFNPAGTIAAIGHSGAPYVTLYNTTTTPWTKLADPVDLPDTGTGKVTGVAFSPDGSLLALSTANTRLAIYNTSTWAKLTNPADLPTHDTTGVAFSPNGNEVTLTYVFTPFLCIYDTTTSPWTKKSNPSTLPTNQAMCVAYNPQGTRTLVGHDDGTFLKLYNVTTTPWTSVTLPATLPGSRTRSVSFNGDGSRAVVAAWDSPTLLIYDTTTSPWTTVANPATVPSLINGIAYSNASPIVVEIKGFSGALPQITSVDISGTSSGPLASGSLEGYLPQIVSSSTSGTRSGTGDVSGDLIWTVTGSMQGNKGSTGALAGDLQVEVTGAIAGGRGSSGTIQGSLPVLTGDLQASRSYSGTVSGELPSLKHAYVNSITYYELTFNTPGTYGWLVPAGITKVDKIRLWGAGAACGATGTDYLPAGGGGGGAFYEVHDLPTVPGQILEYVVGLGGKHNASQYSARNGGDTSFSPNASVTLTAGGGRVPNSPTLGGQGGWAFTSGLYPGKEWCYDGGAGGVRGSYVVTGTTYYTGAAGGGSAGPQGAGGVGSNGNNVNSTTRPLGGTANGGQTTTSALGGVGGRGSGNTNGLAEAGGFPGGGGGSGQDSEFANGYGWGANGLVTISYSRVWDPGDANSPPIVETGVPTYITRRFVYPGTHLWQVPEGVTAIKVQTWDGGQSGRNQQWADPNDSFQWSMAALGGPGIGGKYSRVNSVAVTPGEKLIVTVGAGGIWNINSSLGYTNGGDSSVARGITTLASATIGDLKVGPSVVSESSNPATFPRKSGGGGGSGGPNGVWGSTPPVSVGNLGNGGQGYAGGQPTNAGFDGKHHPFGGNGGNGGYAWNDLRLNGGHGGFPGGGGGGAPEDLIPGNGGDGQVWISYDGHQEVPGPEAATFFSIM